MGAAAAGLLGLQAATGLVLVLFVPAAAPQAALALLDLEEASLWGLVPRLHRWGSDLLILALILHLLRVFLAGGHRSDGGREWRRGVGLLLVVFGLALTGVVLPWNERSRASAASIATLLGAPAPDPQWLTIAFAAHVLVLPLVAGPLIFGHLRRTRIAREPAAESGPEGATTD